VKPTLVALIVLLAGCTHDPTREDAATAAALDLHGVVVDVALVPVADAVVTSDVGNTTTDASGGFRFADVAPGEHPVEVLAPGFVPAQAILTAGKQGRIVLEHVQEDQPYIVRTSLRGYLGCSVQIGPFVQDGLCDAVDPDEGGLLEFGTVIVPDAVQTEVVWEATQTTGQQLGMIQCMVDRGLCQGGDGRMGNLWGPSPLVCRVTATAGCGNADGTGGGNGLDVTGSSGRIEVSVYASCTAACVPGTAAGAGAALQQQYEVFGAAFFGFDPGPDWRFGDPA